MAGLNEESRAETSTSYKWTDDDTQALILWRSENQPLFTGKRHASLEAYSVFLKERGLEGRVNPKVPKKRWKNLVSKYKDLKRPRTGVNTEWGGVTAASWKWYTHMDEAIGSRPSVTPPALFASSSREVAVTPPPPVERGTTSTLSTPKRRWVDRVEELLNVLSESIKQHEEAMQEMKREQQRRDKAREREAAEREERRYKERVEREERRNRESVEREERFLREMREMREREERREMEAAGREERLIAILEKLCK